MPSEEFPESLAPNERDLLARRLFPGVERLIAAASLESADYEQWTDDYLTLIRANNDKMGNYLSRNDVAISQELTEQATYANADIFYSLYRAAYAQTEPLEKSECIATAVTFIRYKPKQYWEPDQKDSSSTVTAQGLARKFYWHVAAITKASRLAGRRDPQLAAMNIATLPTELQSSITNKLMQEWCDYQQLLVAYKLPPDDHYYKIVKPLMHNSLADLQQELANTTQPLLQPTQIIDAFRYNGPSFHRTCQVMRNIMTQPVEKPARFVTGREKLLNERTAALSKDSRYANFVTQRPVMQPLFVDLLENIDEAIQAQAGVFAADLATEYGDPDYSIWGAGVTKKLEEVIKPKNFWGKLQNPRIIRLPISQEFADDYIASLNKATPIERRQILDRLLVVTDMHSTGRGKVGESMQDIVIHAINPESPQSRRIDVSIRKNISGGKVATFLNTEASSSAHLQQILAMSRPTSAGLPSLGTSR